MIIFSGDEKTAYRDPACFYHSGTYYLFFSYSEKDSVYMYNRIGLSTSKDLKNWSVPRLITEKDNRLNYCSPGNIIEHNGKFILCFTSYPMPFSYNEYPYADDTARLFTMSTENFETFSEPMLLNPKGNTPREELGRMIDPFIVEHNGYYLFFKQNNRVAFSFSEDMKIWKYIGETEGGENACILKRDNEFILIHSPANGIGFAKSKDLITWENIGHTTLNQANWNWAEGRLTAAFAMEAPNDVGYKYIIFFHGSKDTYPETHGNATLALAYTNDFSEFYYNE